MASLVYFSFALVILASFVHVDAYLQRYLSLVSNVRDHYQTSSVFFVHSRNNRSLEEYTLAYSLSRDFSQKHVFTLIVNFEELDERANFYRHQIGQPLIVIFLRSVSDVTEFHENTKIMKISHPIWLMIFADEFGRSVCAYCMYPRGNRFRLRFDTEMLVLCCDEFILKEWWAIDDNHTEISDFAIWNMDKEMTVLSFDGLYSRRTDVKGAGFRIGIVTTSVFVHENGKKIGGLFGDVLMELKRAINFTITETVRDTEFGIWDAKANRWTGMICKAAQGKVDLGASDFTVTKRRSEILDYTLHLAVSRSQLYIRNPNIVGVHWTSYFQAFTFQIWIAIIFLIITAPTVLTIIKMRDDSKSLLFLFVENYVYVWGIFCQQGLSELPARTSLKITYFSIYVLSLVISASYSASLTSFLTISSSGLPFTTVEGFVHDGSYKVIAYQNQSQYHLLLASNDPVLAKMRVLMKPLNELPSTFANGWEQICKQKVGLYSNEWDFMMMLETTPDTNIKCEVTAIDAGHPDSLAMIMPHDSQYRNVLNYHILRFQDMGLLNYLKLKHIRTSITDPRRNVVAGANLGGVTPVLATLAGGVILSAIVLFCEKLIHSF